MKLRSFFYLLTALVLVLLLIGAGGFYWLTAQNPLTLLRGQEANPTAAMFVSKQAPLMASLLVNPDRLESFRQVVAPPAERRQARAELNQLKQTLLANTGLDYQRDIQPWLGDEITLALTTLDIDRDDENGRQLGYLLAIATQDPERSREFLQLLWQKRAIAGNDLVFEQYKGVKLIYSDRPISQVKGQSGTKNQTEAKQTTISAPSLASAVVGDRFVLFGNHPKVLREAINNVQATDLNLTSSRLYQRTLDSLTQNRIGLTFVNLPQLAAWLGEEATSAKIQKGSRLEPAPQPYESLAIALGIIPQGLLAETAALTATAQTAATAPALSKPVGALRYIPATSAVSASGTDLNQLWSQVSAGLSGYGALAQLIQPLVTLQQQWGLQLPEDIFSWVKGEYALGAVSGEVKSLPPRGGYFSTPPGATTDNNLSSDWVFVAEKTNAESTQAAIERLDTIARQQGLSVGPLKLGEQTVAVWTRLSTAAANTDPSALSLQADIRGVHTAIGQYEIFATSVKAMDKALKASQNPLITSDAFTQATVPLLKPNHGYLYLDWRSSQTLLERQIPLLRVIELAVKPLFTHLRSITFSSYGNQSGVQRSGIFLKLES